MLVPAAVAGVGGNSLTREVLGLKTGLEDHLGRHYHDVFGGLRWSQDAVLAAM